jgi:hypothetical protein
VRKGELTFLDNAIDKSTGTISARVTIANPDFALLPGEYVRVRLHIKDEPNAVMAPQTALGSSQMGKYVYVVGAGDKAEQRLVTSGTNRRRARLRRQRLEGRRSHHRRQPAEDRSGLADPTLADGRQAEVVRRNRTRKRAAPRKPRADDQRSAFRREWRRASGRFPAPRLPDSQA